MAQRTIDGVGYGKVAIITGCASGVGLATTNLFLSHQYSVLGVDINEMDYSKVSDADQERFHFHRGNLLEEGECEELIRICVAEFGPKLEVLANVAGVMDGFGAADTFSDKEWERVIGINLTVPTRLIRASIPLMKTNGGGSIVNVCSKAAISGAAAGVAYTASKHGLLGVTKNTAFRFRNEGIRCNAVLPGGIAGTNIATELMGGGTFDPVAFGNLKPIFDVHDTPSITTKEIANAILFLCSDGAKSINGISLPVDKAWGVI